MWWWSGLQARGVVLYGTVRPPMPVKSQWVQIPGNEVLRHTEINFWPGARDIERLKIEIWKRANPSIHWFIQLCIDPCEWVSPCANRCVVFQWTLNYRHHYSIPQPSHQYYLSWFAKFTEFFQNVVKLWIWFRDVSTRQIISTDSQTDRQTDRHSSKKDNFIVSSCGWWLSINNRLIPRGRRKKSHTTLNALCWRDADQSIRNH